MLCSLWKCLLLQGSTRKCRCQECEERCRDVRSFRFWSCSPMTIFVAMVSAPVLRSTPGGPHLPPSPLPLPRCGRGRGRVLPHPPPQLPSAPTLRERKDGMSRAGTSLRLLTLPSSQSSSPLSRSAGEGLGVRAARSAGEGPRVRAARSAGEGPRVRAARNAGEGLGVRATPSPSPLAPFHSSTARGRGNMGWPEIKHIGNPARNGYTDTVRSP